MKVIQVAVRTLIFVLSGVGNHWKVSSKEVMCSGLHFKTIALAAVLNRPQNRARVEARTAGRFLSNPDAR